VNENHWFFHSFFFVNLSQKSLLNFFAPSSKNLTSLCLELKIATRLPNLLTVLGDWLQFLGDFGEKSGVFGVCKLVSQDLSKIKQKNKENLARTTNPSK
jgi:hypothetical protein